MTIGALAERAGVRLGHSAHERLCLLPAPPRQSGWRS